MIYFETTFVTIHWDEDASTVWAQWKEPVEGELFRGGLNKGAELVKEKQCRRWLADTKHLGPVPPDDTKWTNEDWFPRVISYGLRSMAFVMPRRIVAQLAVKTVMSRVSEQDLISAYFDDLDEAWAWIRAQK